MAAPPLAGWLIDVFMRTRVRVRLFRAKRRARSYGLVYPFPSTAKEFMELEPEERRALMRNPMRVGQHGEESVLALLEDSETRMGVGESPRFQLDIEMRNYHAGQISQSNLVQFALKHGTGEPIEPPRYPDWKPAKSGAKPADWEPQSSDDEGSTTGTQLGLSEATQKAVEEVLKHLQKGD